MGPARSLEAIHYNQSQKRATNPAKAFPGIAAVAKPGPVVGKCTVQSSQVLSQTRCPRLLLCQRKVAQLLLSLPLPPHVRQTADDKAPLLLPPPLAEAQPCLFLVLFLSLFLCSCPSKCRRNSSVGLFIFLSFLFLFLSFLCLFLESLCPGALGLRHESSNWPKSK